MRELENTDETLLFRLEQRIGAERFLYLITSNGTIFELFSIIKHATQEFAGQLLDYLDEKGVQQLIDKTIASGRSVGTLSLAMRELWSTDESLLIRLEQCIGAERFLNLIKANGTVFELFGILRHGTPQFSSQLLDQLEKKGVQA